MLDWLIIGGGLHGSHIARRLQAACPGAAVAVMDPAASALSAWQRRANACGMFYLRSSQAHHLGLRADALRVFAREHGYDASHSLGRYRRPSRGLFEAHAEAVTSTVPRIAARAEAIAPQGHDWQVTTRAGAHYTARRLVLAPGPPAPQRPRWGSELAHVFDQHFAARSANWSAAAHIAIVGGGISAAQYATACARAGHAVTMLSRHPLRQCAFDSDPCYAGPRCLTTFARLPLAQRPALLAQVRNPATMPADVHAELAALLAMGAVRWLRGDVVALHDDGLRLADGRRVAADRVVLATGFAAGAGPLLEHVAQHLQLPLDSHGYAHIDAQLAWAPGLHVAGRPASLRLGPMAGNIRGAQLAGKRLAAMTHHAASRAPDHA